MGEEALPLDKFVRTMGQNRMVEKHMSEIRDVELIMYENFAAGVNKLVEEIHMYPLEFYIVGRQFRPWTTADTVSIMYLMTNQLAGDWFFEIARGRLLEVYPRETVDKILPYNADVMFPFAN